MSRLFFSLTPFHRLLAPLYNTLSSKERQDLVEFESYLQKGASAYDAFKRSLLLQKMLQSEKLEFKFLMELLLNLTIEGINSQLTPEDEILKLKPKALRRNRLYQQELALLKELHHTVIGAEAFQWNKRQESQLRKLIDEHCQAPYKVKEKMMALQEKLAKTDHNAWFQLFWLKVRIEWLIFWNKNEALLVNLIEQPLWIQRPQPVNKHNIADVLFEEHTILPSQQVPIEQPTANVAADGFPLLGKTAHQAGIQLNVNTNTQVEEHVVAEVMAVEDTRDTTVAELVRCSMGDRMKRWIVQEGKTVDQEPGAFFMSAIRQTNSRRSRDSLAREFGLSADFLRRQLESVCRQRGLMAFQVRLKPEVDRAPLCFLAFSESQARAYSDRLSLPIETIMPCPIETIDMESLLTTFFMRQGVNNPNLVRLVVPSDLSRTHSVIDLLNLTELIAACDITTSCPTRLAIRPLAEGSFWESNWWESKPIDAWNTLTVQNASFNAVTSCHMWEVNGSFGYPERDYPTLMAKGISSLVELIRTPGFRVDAEPPSVKLFHRCAKAWSDFTTLSELEVHWTVNNEYWLREITRYNKQWRREGSVVKFTPAAITDPHSGYGSILFSKIFEEHVRDPKKHVRNPVDLIGRRDEPLPFIEYSSFGLQAFYFVGTLCASEHPVDRALAGLFEDLACVELDGNTNLFFRLFLNFSFDPALQKNLDWREPGLMMQLRWLASLRTRPDQEKLYQGLDQLLVALVLSYESVSLGAFLGEFRALVELDNPAVFEVALAYLKRRGDKPLRMEHLRLFLSYVQQQQRLSQPLTEARCIHALETIDTWIDGGIPPDELDDYLEQMKAYHYGALHVGGAWEHRGINQWMNGGADKILVDSDIFKRAGQALATNNLPKQVAPHQLVDAIFYRVTAIVSGQTPVEEQFLSAEEAMAWYAELLKAPLFDDPVKRLALAEILGKSITRPSASLVLNTWFPRETFNLDTDGLRAKERMIAWLRGQETMPEERKADVLRAAGELANIPMGMVRVGLSPELVPMLLTEMRFSEQDMASDLHRAAQENLDRLRAMRGVDKQELGQVRDLIRYTETFLVQYQAFVAGQCSMFPTLELLCRDYIVNMARILDPRMSLSGDQRLIDPKHADYKECPKDFLQSVPKIFSNVITMIRPWVVVELNQLRKLIQVKHQELSKAADKHKTFAKEQIERTTTALVQLASTGELNAEEQAYKTQYEKIDRYFSAYLTLSQQGYKAEKERLQQEGGEDADLRFMALCAAVLFRYQSILLRPNQCLALLRIIRDERVDCLLQMDTGEGKTIPLNMWILLKAFKHPKEPVDLFAHSRYMASKQLFPQLRMLGNLLGFEVGCPLIEGPSAFAKQVAVVDMTTMTGYATSAKFTQQGPLFIGTGSPFADPLGIRKAAYVAVDEGDVVADLTGGEVLVIPGDAYPDALQEQYQHYFVFSNAAIALMQLLCAPQESEDAANLALYQQLVKALIEDKGLNLDVSTPDALKTTLETRLRDFGGMASDLQVPAFTDESLKFANVVACLNQCRAVKPDQQEAARALSATWEGEQWKLDVVRAQTAAKIGQQSDVMYRLYEVGKDEKGNVIKQVAIILQATSGERSDGFWGETIQQRVECLEQARDFKSIIMKHPLFFQLGSGSIDRKLRDYTGQRLLVGATFGNAEQTNVLTELLQSSDKTIERRPTRLLKLQRAQANRRSDTHTLILPDKQALYESLVTYAKTQRSDHLKRANPPLLIVFSTEAGLSRFLDSQAMLSAAELDPIVLRAEWGQTTISSATLATLSKPGQVGVSTSIAARGVDLSVYDVVVVADDEEHPFDRRQIEQIKGRTGRSGREGRTRVYATQDCMREISSKKQESADVRLSQIADARSDLLAQQASLKRQQGDVIDVFQNMYIEYQASKKIDPLILRERWQQFLNDHLLPWVTMVDVTTLAKEEIQAKRAEMERALTDALPPEKLGKRDLTASGTGCGFFDTDASKKTPVVASKIPGPSPSDFGAQS